MFVTRLYFRQSGWSCIFPQELFTTLKITTWLTNVLFSIFAKNNWHRCTINAVYTNLNLAVSALINAKNCMKCYILMVKSLINEAQFCFSVFSVMQNKWGCVFGVVRCFLRGEVLLKKALDGPNTWPNFQWTSQDFFLLVQLSCQIWILFLNFNG